MSAVTLPEGYRWSTMKTVDTGRRERRYQLREIVNGKPKLIRTTLDASEVDPFVLAGTPVPKSAMTISITPKVFIAWAMFMAGELS